MNDSIILANTNSMMLKIHEYTRCQTIQGHPIKMRKIKVKKENGWSCNGKVGHIAAEIVGLKVWIRE